MNLDNLKPAWRHFKLVNSIQKFDQHDILLMIEDAEEPAVSKTNRYILSALMFIVLTLCVQGG